MPLKLYETLDIELGREIQGSGEYIPNPKSGKPDQPAKIWNPLFAIHYRPASEPVETRDSVCHVYGV